MLEQPEMTPLERAAEAANTAVHRKLSLCMTLAHLFMRTTVSSSDSDPFLSLSARSQAPLAVPNTFMMLPTFKPPARHMQHSVAPCSQTYRLHAAFVITAGYDVVQLCKLMCASSYLRVLLPCT